MENEVMRSHMMKFSLEDLKSFLGEDLVESLLEWNTGSEALLTKKRLVDMIMCIYGVNILKSKEFRHHILSTFQKEDILDFRVELPEKYRTCEDPELIIDVVAKKNWRESQINNHVLHLLNYSEKDIFQEQSVAEVSSEKIASYDKFYELLDYQYIIRQRALNILTSEYKQRRFLIHMPTGTGKTKTATHIICHHYNYNLKKQGLIVWIAHTTELLQQAYDTFVSVWKNIGNGEISTYKLWGEHNIEAISEDMSGFMVCGIQKLQSMKENQPDKFQKLVNATRLVVYDEAHKAAAQETRNVIEHFMRRTGEMKDCALMGLSATPGRTTEMSFENDLLASTFGNKIISIDTKVMNEVNLSRQEALNAEVEKDIIRYFQNRGVLAKIKKKELTYAEKLTDEELSKIKVIATKNGYSDFSPAALNVIGKNKSRNLRIMQELRALNQSQTPTIVFACSVKHGQLLSSMLTLEDIPNALVIGEMSATERREAIRKFKDTKNDMNILINYEVLTTGFDATNIECVFIARPTQSVVLYSQMLGRGLRGPQMGGKKECLLIDVKDNLNQFNENMAFSHFNNYWNA